MLPTVTTSKCTYPLAFKGTGLCLFIYVFIYPNNKLFYIWVRMYICICVSLHTCVCGYMSRYVCARTYMRFYTEKHSLDASWIPSLSFPQLVQTYEVWFMCQSSYSYRNSSGDQIMLYLFRTHRRSANTSACWVTQVWALPWEGDPHLVSFFNSETEALDFSCSISSLWILSPLLLRNYIKTLLVEKQWVIVALLFIGKVN